MPRTEEGEFELVLGNKQLLSVFFIIVILLGVFFTMGYIVGRNSAPVSANADRNPNVQPITPRPDGPSAMPTKPQSEQSGAPAASEPAQQPTQTPANADTAAPANPQQSGAATPEANRAPERPAETATSGAAGKVVNPEPGQTFVQVSSMLDDQAAQILVDVLGKKGFRAIIAPGPNEGKFRVLVGPLKDATDVGRVRGDLEQAGFKGAFLKKY